MRGGLKTVLIPVENEKDLADIPANVKKGLEIIPVAMVDEVLSKALVSEPLPAELAKAGDLPVVGGGVEESGGKVVTH